MGPGAGEKNKMGERKVSGWHGFAAEIHSPGRASAALLVEVSGSACSERVCLVHWAICPRDTGE